LPEAIAICNNEVAFLAWRYESKIENCLGFGIYRTNLNDRQANPIILPAWVGFRGEDNRRWAARRTTEWPIQKFSWRDLTIKNLTGFAVNGFFEYRIVPMVGTPGNLRERNDLEVRTNPVLLTYDFGGVKVFFNRGIISKQGLVRKITEPQGTPNYGELARRIRIKDDPLRISLAGDMIEAMKSLFLRARNEGGRCYCALYELNDDELEQMLIDPTSVSIILANANGTTYDETNKRSRALLRESGVDIVDRMLKSNHIGHNKFIVYVDGSNIPRTVLTGSTNWTSTGLWTQTNNTIILESRELATYYYDYWQSLRRDQSQEPPLRQRNGQGNPTIPIDNQNTNVKLWFSPNTKRRTKPKAGLIESDLADICSERGMPSDLRDVCKIIASAQQGILFLAFQLGRPSILDMIGYARDTKPHLFIRGAVTDPDSVGEYETHLWHRSDGPIDFVHPDIDIIHAAAVRDNFSFWIKELLKLPGAHAIIHDKVVVTDPFSPRCTVITGSHNLGYKASYSNDENMVIISGNMGLSAAYATHIMDVYDHYRWRFKMQNEQERTWDSLYRDDSWQDKYYSQTSSYRNDMDFWFNR
jgi:phosphatidylserine/phosphatidylglycerophosphate/cardiolipin synthase-like enzyme